MPTAHQLPSGSWRCQVRVNGVRRSVTASSRRAAELAASELLRSSVSASPAEGTVGDAVDRYLSDKSGILSPSTLYSYKKIRKNNLTAIASVKLSHLTNAHVQKFVNSLATSLRPKTVRNIYGLLTATLKYTRPDLILSVSLPPPERTPMSIPSNSDLCLLLENCHHNDDLLTAVLLASSCGLRLSEICALTWQDLDLDAGTVTINKALVRAPGGSSVLKSPKSQAGYRTVTIPPPTVAYLIQRKGTASPTDRLISRSPHAVHDAFLYVTRRLGFRFRFHDLRHYYASVLLALGVPDKYAMQRMGHATAYTLQNVYQHLMEDKQTQIDDSISSHFTSILDVPAKK